MSMTGEGANRTRRIASTLAYAGAIPFAFVALLAVAGQYDAAPFDARQALLVYSAVILSFLAGIHWQIAIGNDGAPRNLMVMSNVVALAAWVIVFLEPLYIAWLFFAILYVKVLSIDRVLFGDGLLQQWFYRLRFRVSSIVVASLLVVAGRDIITMN